jgi:hypothetical protein
VIVLTGLQNLANEIKKYKCVCFYPSAGADLSDVDYFASGKRPWGERAEENLETADFDEIDKNPYNDPDLFIHTDVNFYHEYAEGADLIPEEHAINSNCEILSFRELPEIKEPNLIHDNYEFSGKCFEYKLRLWGSNKIRTLIFLLCENEFLIAKLFLPNKLKLRYVWSKNWNGGMTYGTWLVNALDKLETFKVYTDWLCVPGRRGEPRNRFIDEKYPELSGPPRVKLVRNNEVRWIDESAHGWIEEFDVVKL